ncbi:MAG: hypothetical protein JNM89_04980 [Hyphomicrobiaceae bacterium]|nr:hypothetical protein [Hyphomicrobiaceae bacterium]
MLHHIEFCLDEIDCEIDSHLGSAISEADAATLKSKIAEFRAILASCPFVAMADDAAVAVASSHAIVDLVAEAAEVPATTEIAETTDAPAEIVELIAEAAELPATAEIAETTDAPAEIVELIAEAAAIAADNLLLIRGMDDETATLLNGKGMTFAAMTGWRAADIAELALDARRVASEGWIEQAAVLATGRLTHFAARVERGELACVVAKMDEIALPALASISVTTADIETVAAEEAITEAITEETTAPTLIVSSSYLPPVFDGMPAAKTEVTEAASKVESKVEAETAKDETTATNPEAKIEIDAKSNVIELAPRTSDRKWLRRASLAASLLLLMSVGVIGMQHKLPSMNMIQQIVSVD